MKCPKCESGYHKFSNFTPDGQSLKDFILWKEVGFMLVLITVCVLTMGIFGLAVAYAIDTITKANGGNIFRYDEPEPNIKHTEGKDCLIGKHTYCKII